MVTKPYLERHWKTVARKNRSGGYKIIQSKGCIPGETVWILDGEEFIRTKIMQ
tara:strand:+ start:205 stop:363 length:159 start_codon:yes stop_codon:yes gene_type:complete